MSVYVNVAYIANVRAASANDDENGSASLREQFHALADAAKAEGVTGYEEPVEGEYWSAQLHPGNGVEYLQRLAWALWRDQPLPTPGTMDDDSIDDGILYDMEAHIVDRMGSTNEKGRSFEHLCFHRVRQGYWIPVDFESVLAVSDEFVGCLGSSVRLLKELEWLAESLELDLGLDHDDKKLWDALEHAGTGQATWQKYGVESFNCLRMYRACQKSIEYGAAITFS